MKEIWRGSFFSLFEDGTLGHDDGVGFVGESSAEEVKEFYKALKRFYGEETVKQLSKEDHD